MEEADLVLQAKLIRSKDQRVPRLQDLTMRPTLAGKTIGALEAHSNGLRFSSQRHAVSGYEGVWLVVQVSFPYCGNYHYVFRKEL